MSHKNPKNHKNASSNVSKTMLDLAVYENIIKNISKLENKDGDKNVTFVFEASDIKIKAHKLLLVAASNVFEAMFSGNFAEEDQVKITDITPEVFQLMIR